MQTPGDFTSRKAARGATELAVFLTRVRFGAGEKSHPEETQDADTLSGVE